jgi:hypothetical protein
VLLEMSKTSRKESSPAGLALLKMKGLFDRVDHDWRLVSKVLWVSRDDVERSQSQSVRNGGAERINTRSGNERGVGHKLWKGVLL